MSSLFLSKLIHSVVGELQLDLRGLTVLTECASGPFEVTPLLALAGGSERVIAMGSDSKFGKFDDNKEQIIRLADEFGYRGRLEFVKSYEKCTPSEIDIVTNLRMLRPIPDAFIKEMKATSAIALMFEPWEYRAADFSFEFATKNGVAVIGTNESNPLVGTFHYVGVLALKLLLENHIPVFQSKIWVVGDDVFGNACRNVLEKLGAKVELTVTSPGIAKLRPAQIPDALIVMEHKNSHPLRISPNTTSDEPWVHPSVKVIHICGNLDPVELETLGLESIPRIPAAFGYMSFNTSYLGSEPVARLHGGGIKAAEIVVRSRKLGTSITQSISNAVDSGFGLAFTE